MNQPLFRSEVIQNRRDRLSGEVFIATPMAWQVIGWLMLAGLLVAAIYFATATYSRVETVSGSITYEDGVAAVVPQRAGMISRVLVEEGAIVAGGAALVEVSVDADQLEGPSTGTLVRSALNERSASLQFQSSALSEAAIAQQSELRAQRSGLVAEINAIRSQVALQQELVETAQSDLDRAVEIADRGFVSGQDLRSREERLVLRQQQLSQLQQSLSVKRASLSEVEQSIARLAARSEADLAALEASRAALEQEAATANNARAYVLRAPFAGRVEAVVVREGQPTSTSPLMMVVPEGSKLQAELSIPASAIGFVEVGQKVQLAVDAFPYQRFGTVSGRVVSVSSVPITKPAESGGEVPVYPAVIELEATSINAYGREQRLLPGMNLTARIIAEEQSLLQWLLDPIFASGRFAG